MRCFIGIPVVLNEKLAIFRNFYDMRAFVLEPHVTIIPPFEEAKLIDDVIQQIEKIALRHKKMTLYLNGCHITDRGHLFYLFDEESTFFLQTIYQELYPLFSQKPDRRPFFPHVMLSKINPHWIDEQFINGLSSLCILQEVSVHFLRLYKSVGMKEKRVIVRDFTFDV